MKKVVGSVFSLNRFVVILNFFVVKVKDEK